MVAISLIKSHVNNAQSGELQFLTVIASDHPISYCEASSRQRLIDLGVSLGLGRDRAEATFDLEMERRGIANEAILLERLDAVLRRFTDRDRKLDEKERRDAMQIVCKATSGFDRGLHRDVADRYVTQFCRDRGVKVKVGLLKWAVP